MTTENEITLKTYEMGQVYLEGGWYGLKELEDIYVASKRMNERYKETLRKQFKEYQIKESKENG